MSLVLRRKDKKPSDKQNNNRSKLALQRGFLSEMVDESETAMVASYLIAS